MAPRSYYLEELVSAFRRPSHPAWLTEPDGRSQRHKRVTQATPKIWVQKAPRIWLQGQRSQGSVTRGRVGSWTPPQGSQRQSAMSRTWGARPERTAGHGPGGPVSVHNTMRLLEWPRFHRGQRRRGGRGWAESKLARAPHHRKDMASPPGVP